MATLKNTGRCTENRTLVYWLKASYFTTKLCTQICQTNAHYMDMSPLFTFWVRVRICLAGVLGIEPRTTESKSVVIPLHYTPTKSRIVKEHFSTMAIKQKTLWIFISEGLVSILVVSVIYLPNPLNHSQSHIQILGVSMSNHLIVGDASAWICFLSSWLNSTTPLVICQALSG